jgi:hypothetical protein
MMLEAEISQSILKLPKTWRPGYSMATVTLITIVARDPINWSAPVKWQRSATNAAMASAL